MKLASATALLIIVSVNGCNSDNTAPESSTPIEGEGEVDSEGTDEVDEDGEVIMLNPDELLFSTPTLNDAIPTTLEGATVPVDCIQLHEDDWRQFEFVTTEFISDVNAELTDISAIWDNHSVPLGESGVAFREVHIRRRVPHGLSISMSLSDFELLVGQETKTMTFFGYGEVLSDVYAVKIDKLIVYAQIHDDSVTALGFHAGEPFTLPTGFSERLRAFVRTHKIMLVHWRSRTLFESHEDVSDYFGIHGQ